MPCRPALMRVVHVLAWAVCAALPALAQQGQGDESVQGAAWISSTEHQRVILPRLSTPPAPDADRAAVAVERLLRQPASTPARAGRLTPEMAQMLQRASRHFAVDAHLVQAVIHAESAYNPRAVSPKNAIGLMQVLPSTARDLGLQDLQGQSVEQLLADPRVSIVLGTKYLAEQLARFGGNVELAVAAYNAGPGAVIKAGHRVPNYPETRHYVRRVLSLAQAYRRGALQGEPT